MVLYQLRSLLSLPMNMVFLLSLVFNTNNSYANTKNFVGKAVCLDQKMINDDLSNINELIYQYVKHKEKYNNRAQFLTELIVRADDNLYKAKEKVRNQFMSKALAQHHVSKLDDDNVNKTT